MKYLFLFFSLFALVACSETSTKDTADQKIEEGFDQIREGLEMKADSAASYLEIQKAKAEEEINVRIKELDARIEALKKDGTQKSREAGEELEENKRELEKNLDEVKSSSETTWDKTRQSLDSTLRKADRKWESVKSNFRDLFR